MNSGLGSSAPMGPCVPEAVLVNTAYAPMGVAVHGGGAGIGGGLA